HEFVARHHAARGRRKRLEHAHRLWRHAMYSARARKCSRASVNRPLANMEAFHSIPLRSADARRETQEARFAPHRIEIRVAREKRAARPAEVDALFELIERK